MSYKYHPGDVVTLIEPDNHDNFTSGWVTGFEEYCGTQVMIKEKGHKNTKGFPCYFVYFENGYRQGKWVWDEEYMSPLLNMDITEQDFDDFWEAEDVCKI